MKKEVKAKSIKAAGLFGKTTPMPLPEPLPADRPVPECAAFEEDFTSYLKRLGRHVRRNKGTVSA
ncbi:hypothetical protein [Alterisphingorhabdus coralli]|uniref:Uncharacterized protein n=1 Tax=Alterisphingorhabdus coralli TaxID=3071408 RepID=A0AA97F5X8_9SPHN|nr:hypothetical protein [Parasphingorhabdus sp. SCSIO 66989]WOE73913.1 hypothetical protein RB602_08550 [Parasphingorhabdus sp. SCSIO 66989]